MRRPNIAAMHHELPSPLSPALAAQDPPGTTAHPGPVSTTQAAASVAVAPTLPSDVPRSSWRAAFARLQGALQRAEQRITENFRVPPHGG